MSAYQKHQFFTSLWTQPAQGLNPFIGFVKTKKEHKYFQFTGQTPEEVKIKIMEYQQRHPDLLDMSDCGLEIWGV